MRAELAAKLVLGVIYTVGVAGLLSTGWQPYFVRLSPINLLVSFALLLFCQKPWKLATLLRVMWVCLLGFGVEVLGVHTGHVFGHYSYGAALGPKLWDVPLVIGINWGMLVLAATGVTASLTKTWPYTALMAGLMLAVLDVVIEPVAIRLGFWQWQGPVPLQNSLAWLCCGTLLSAILTPDVKTTSNPLASSLLAIQLVFFSLLALLL